MYWHLMCGQKLKINNTMKSIRKILNGVSIGFASVMLMSSGSLALDNSYKVANEDSLSVANTVEDIVFDEDCVTCRYITVYDSNDNLVFDGIVNDKNNIKNKKLRKILKKSDYLMSNRITDYYILTN